MPFPPQLPPSLRYLNARLRFFRSTMFWGSLTVLSLVGVFVWEAWHHPEWLFPQTEDEESVSTTESDATKLSKEDSAIAADIDSLPVLIQEMDSAKLNLPPINVNAPNSTQQTPNPVNQLIDQQMAEAVKAGNSAQTGNLETTSGSQNPFLQQLQQQFNFDASNAGIPGTANASAYSNNNLNNPASPNSRTLPVSPLQAALERYANPISPPQPTPTPQVQTPSDNKPAAESNPLTQQRNQPIPTVPGQGYIPAAPYPMQGYSPVPGQGYQSGNAYVAPAYPTVGGQVYPTGSVYVGTPVYPSTVPGQVYQSISPYTGAPVYNAPSQPIPVVPSNVPINGVNINQQAGYVNTVPTGIPGYTVNPNIAPQLQPSGLPPQPINSTPVPRRIPRGDNNPLINPNP
jgi:pterin-4a-carbinolamine dehydratase